MVIVTFVTYKILPFYLCRFFVKHHEFDATESPWFVTAPHVETVSEVRIFCPEVGVDSKVTLFQYKVLARVED